MRTNTLLFNLIFFTFLHLSHAQEEHCESTDESLVELNSINKCSIGKKKSNKKNKFHTRHLAIRSTSSRRRLVEKKSIVKKEKATGLTTVESNGVNSIDVKNIEVAEIVNPNEEIDDSVVMPFDIVHQKPVFSSCNNDVSKKCFDSEIAKHIKKHFSYPKAAYKNGIEGKVIVRFKINKQGQVFDVKGSATSSEKEILKLEAERIISELPEFLPAKHTNKLVNVSYGVPIIFKL